MKIKIERGVFHNSLSLASRFTSSKFSSLSSLSGVYLKMGGNEINMYSSDLNSYLHTKIKAKAEGKSECVIEPRKLLEFISLLPEGELEVEIKEKQIVVKSGKTQGAFPLMKAEDFPFPPKIEEEEQILKTDFLIKNLPLVLFSASGDETRPALSGVNLLTNEDFVIVATDGFRLSLVKIEKNKELPSCIIPAGFLKEILSLLKEEKEVGFSFSKKEKIIVFRIGETKLYSRLIEGDFPPFEKVIPEQKSTTVVVERDEFLRNIKLVSVFARDLSNIVILEVGKKELGLRPKTDGEEVNSATIEAGIEGDEQKVAFNYKFLLELLSVVDAKNITIEIMRSDAPVVFKTDNKNFIHIIMPVRIQE